MSKKVKGKLPRNPEYRKVARLAQIDSFAYHLAKFTGADMSDTDTYLNYTADARSILKRNPHYFTLDARKRI